MIESTEPPSLNVEDALAKLEALRGAETKSRAAPQSMAAAAVETAGMKSARAAAGVQGAADAAVKSALKATAAKARTKTKASPRKG